MPPSVRVIVWAERGQDGLIRDALDATPLDLVAVGASSATTAAELSQALGAPRIDDLRQAIQRDDVDVLWLASPEQLDPSERRFIRERGVPCVSNEPRPIALGDLLADPREAGTAEVAPLLRRGAGYRAALDALADFGPPRCVSITFGCRTGETALLSRLFDAFDVLNALVSPVEQIDAALAAPRGSAPERLADLHGSLSANVRCAGSACAAIAVSDRAGSWFRQVTLVGEHGWMRIDDTSFAWMRSDGEQETGGASGPIAPGALIGAQIVRHLENLDAGAASDAARLLTWCEAARVSCRTGQSEAPGRLVALLGRP